MKTAPRRRLEHLSSIDQQAAMEFVDKVLQRFDGQVISILMFGSRARGEAEPDSDMDLLVVMSDADLHRRAIRYIAVEVW